MFAHTAEIDGERERTELKYYFMGNSKVQTGNTIRYVG